MAGLFQGDPIYGTTVAEAQQTAPEFYTNYLQDIANLGQNAVQQGGIAGFSPLQQQALSMAPDIAFSGAGSLGAASQLLGQAGATTVPDVVGGYMNPYTQNVVNEMGRLSARNLQENVLPNLGGAAIGTGQFGSRRQQQITGNVLRDISADLLGKQMGALQAGYTEAGRTAQADLSRALQAGQAFENLGQQQQQLGLGGLKALTEYGGLEQAQAQKALDLPMQQAQAFAKLMQGYNVPFGSTTQTIAPGTFSASPLSQVATLLAGLGSFFSPTTKQTTVPVKKDGGSITKPPMSVTHRGKGRRFANGGAAESVSYHDGKGNFYDANGYLVG